MQRLKSDKSSNRPQLTNVKVILSKLSCKVTTNHAEESHSGLSCKLTVRHTACKGILENGLQDQNRLDQIESLKKLYNPHTELTIDMLEKWKSSSTLLSLILGKGFKMPLVQI